MEHFGSTSGFNSDASLPRTPPYTPHRTKRPFERSDSPASVRSLHPAETSSPAKKVVKRAVEDDVEVEELTEGDAGYTTDMEVIYPDELEEVDSDSEEEPSDSDVEADESDDVMTDKFSRLGCDDNGEVIFEKSRREKHARKRKGSRVYKRSHSQTVVSGAEPIDTDAMGDQDLSASARRLRRRVRGPDEMQGTLSDREQESLDHGAQVAANETPVASRRADNPAFQASGEAVEDVMEVDDSQ